MEQAPEVVAPVGALSPQQGRAAQHSGPELAEAQEPPQVVVVVPSPERARVSGQPQARVPV